MVTVKISIKKHLEEYMRGKFNDCREGVITLPDKTDLYHTLFDLTSKRPASCPLEQGTLEIALPDRRCGKDRLTTTILANARSESLSDG